RNGQRIGTLLESVTSARAYARRVARLTDLDVVVQRGGSTLAGTLPGSKEVSSGSQTVEIDGRDFRTRASRIRDANGGPITVALLDEAAGIEDAITTSRLVVIGIVLAFLLFALAFSLLVVRGLHGQVGQFLEAARRIGKGDFAQRVPVTGSDEFADLGREFNSMSEQLESKIEEVEHKRRELEETIRRVGQAFASGLDPQGVVELAVQTAVDACDAEAGRALAGEAFPLRTLRVGSQGPEPSAALQAAEQAARGGYGEAKSEPATIERNGVHALAVPLLARLGTATRVSDLGVISIARRYRPFDHSDEQLLEYLAGQAVVSIENADLHETVQRQAITDELTGLCNVRELQHALDQEVERGRRFHTAVGFVMLDLDDFKQINDQYGHPQGDDVLVAVARVLHSLSRDIDQPARYGGEELAVVLPETELEGAALLADRMREAIEELRVPIRGSDGVLRVTASFGVASIPECAHDSGTVIEAADAALYRAKRAGKNRVERAEPVHASR
ncbi:MAG: diguanylate cyclase, partial [Solirubrobacteraceae bacterium]